MREIPDSARWLANVFPTADALSIGWTTSGLRHAVRTGDLWRPRNGAYALPPPDGPGRRLAVITQHAVAAALTNHRVRVSHLASAHLTRLAAWAPEPRACVTHDGGGVTSIGSVHCHRAEVSGADAATLEGRLLITSPARTVVDVAREFGVEAGVVIADCALRTPLGNRDRLLAAVRTARGRPHVERAREALVLADPRSESVLESRSRYRMTRAGLPAPRTQVDILDLFGTFYARVDFYWPEFGVVGEADGLAKYAADGAVVGEKFREDALRDLGLQVARWGWGDLDPFDGAVARIQRAFARGATTVGPRRWRAVQRPLAELPPRMWV